MLLLFFLVVFVKAMLFVFFGVFVSPPMFVDMVVMTVLRRGSIRRPCLSSVCR